MLTIGSLFSGIGGLELGLEMAGLGPVLWQVEREPFCRAVLEKHYPEALRFDDVCTVGAAQLVRPDLICGGFPCQDVSGAGKGAGLAGERSGLWREFARIVEELRPRWVVVENVAGGAKKWLDTVVRDLEERGYASLPVPLSASDVGAPHRRARVFVVAHAHGLDVREQPGGGGRTSRAGAPEPRDDGARWAAPDHVHSRREGPRTQAHEGWCRPAPGFGWAPQSGVVPVVHGLSGGLVGRGRRARIRSLGNSVVPQQAEVVGWVIRELIAQRESA